MFRPQDDPLGVGLKSRARASRDAFNIASDDDALAAGGLGALQQSRANNLHAGLMSEYSPGMDAWLQSLTEAAGGKAVRLQGAESPDGSTQLHGFGSELQALDATGRPSKRRTDAPYEGSESQKDLYRLFAEITAARNGQQVSPSMSALHRAAGR